MLGLGLVGPGLGSAPSPRNEELSGSEVLQVGKSPFLTWFGGVGSGRGLAYSGLAFRVNLR